MELKSNFLTRASELELTNPDEVQEAISDLKVNKVPGPNRIPNSLETSSSASGIPPRSDLQRCAPHPSFPSCVEARKCNLNT